MAKCMSHINSYKRQSIDWNAPIDMTRAVFPPDLLDGLGIEKIEPKKVNLTPNLVPHAILISQKVKR
jgi:transposase, IS30 family